jgi:uncharacterized protein
VPTLPPQPHPTDFITDLARLETIYGTPGAASLVKEVPRITPQYRAYIEASPFCALATIGPSGLDCTPRGDRPGELVRVLDDTTLALPDRRGNNRIDSLRNIIADPRVALLFLIPGSVTTLRVNGTAAISVAPDLLTAFTVDGKAPRTVLMITVETVYFQCGRAILRSELWNPARHVAEGSLPTPGQILAVLSDSAEGGADYDQAWPQRARQSLW